MPGLIAETRVNGIPLYVPPALHGVLPPSPCRLNFPFEHLAFLGIESFVKPGAVVFDAGCSYGVISALAARLVGPLGRVYAFDASAEVLPAATALWESNGLRERIEFWNVCVGEASGRDVDFHLVPGTAAAASSRSESLGRRTPGARRVSAPLIAWDDLCASGRLPRPDVIKLDIEGSEWCAIRGARQLLKQSVPDLVIETHSSQIPEIGGSLADLCAELVSFGYELFDLSEGRKTTATEFSGHHTQGTAHLLASDSLREEGVCESLARRHSLCTAISEQSMRVWNDLYQAREYVNALAPRQALPLLRGFLLWGPDVAEAHYLLGCALDRLGEHAEALREFDFALRNGFEEYWVVYNRGCLYAKTGEGEKAIADLIRACELRPEQDGPRQALQTIES